VARRGSAPVQDGRQNSAVDGPDRVEPCLTRGMLSFPRAFALGRLVRPCFPSRHALVGSPPGAMIPNLPKPRTNRELRPLAISGRLRASMVQVVRSGSLAPAGRSASVPPSGSGVQSAVDLVAGRQARDGSGLARRLMRWLPEIRLAASQPPGVARCGYPVGN
jgi:hypothetical protein